MPQIYRRKKFFFLKKRDEAEIQLRNARNGEMEGMKQGGGRGMIGRVWILSLFFFGLGRERERERVGSEEGTKVTAVKNRDLTARR